MPIFDYKCEKCNDTVEKIIPNDYKGEVICEKCGSTMKKLPPTGIGIKYKGSGFYCTDH